MDYARAIAAHIWARAELPGEPPPIFTRPVKRGRWDAGGWIVVPEWLWTEGYGDDFAEYYVAHELAHHRMGRHGHGLVFQLILWSLAPATWHYEASYKPRHYAAAHVCIYGPPGI